MPTLVQLLAISDVPQFEFFVSRLITAPASTIPLVQQSLQQLPRAESESAKERSARTRANLLLALWRLGRSETACGELHASTDPRLRYHLIHGLATCRIDPASVGDALIHGGDASVRAALILALGDYDDETVPAAVRSAVLTRCDESYRTHPDTGVHSAAQWLMAKWGYSAAPVQHPLETATARGTKWFTNSQGQTFAILRHPENSKVVSKSFALSTMPVTVAQYRAFRPEYSPDKGLVPEVDCPVNMVSFYDAAAYCNWLTEQERLPLSEICYSFTYSAKGKPTAAQVSLNRRGYQLVTEDEWKIAYRAGATTGYFFGEQADYLPRYARFYDNTQGHVWPVTSVRPNAFGMFDICGNLATWAHRLTANLERKEEIMLGGTWSSQGKYLRWDEERIGTAGSFYTN